jgi:hypothetical protein
MTTDEQQMLDQIPVDGSPIGNARLRRTLGWDENDENRNKYWEVRDRLINKGLVVVGLGKGGSVRRVVTANPVVQQPETEPNVTEASSSPDEPVAPLRKREEALYEPIAKILEERWVRERRFENSIVHVTALQGRKPTGKWSRPDVAIATVSTYPWVPGRHFDVITFEVKPSDAIDLTSVYEALAHLRSATQAYVVLHVPDDQRENLQPQIEEVMLVARQHGVGVITFENPDDFETWETLVEAERSQPDPRRLNDFLALQFTQEKREKLLRWLK